MHWALFVLGKMAWNNYLGTIKITAPLIAMAAGLQDSETCFTFLSVMCSRSRSFSLSLTFCDTCHYNAVVAILPTAIVPRAIFPLLSEFNWIRINRKGLRYNRTIFIQLLNLMFLCCGEIFCDFFLVCVKDEYKLLQRCSTQSTQFKYIFHVFFIYMFIQ